MSKRFALCRRPVLIQKNQAPSGTEPDGKHASSTVIGFKTLILDGQRPKNNHNRIITGIGTPSSQSKSPRPIVSSMLVNVATKNAK
jgi:hypothetical protein